MKRLLIATNNPGKIREIAELKMKDMNAADIEAAMRMIEGSARAMGMDVEG